MLLLVCARHSQVTLLSFLPELRSDPVDATFHVWAGVPRERVGFLVMTVKPGQGGHGW